MTNSIMKVSLERATREEKNAIDDIVTAEFPLTIVLNGRELVTLLCSPADLNYLAVGFLVSESFLSSSSDIKKLIVDERHGIVHIETTGNEKTNEETFKRFIASGCGRGASFYSASDIGYIRVESPLTIPSENIFTLVKEFQNRSQNYRATGGVHSAALCDIRSIVVFNEDIGRHNAIDKVFGQCLLENIPTENHMIVTSGRITSEIILKIIKRNVPVLISRSAPTDLAIKLAQDAGITLIGFVRGSRMNIYTNGWRVTAASKRATGLKSL